MGVRQANLTTTPPQPPSGPEIPRHTSLIIIVSCLTGNAECVQLMIDEGALMEAHDCHFGTPLHVACARQHYDCAEVLLKAGESVPDRRREPRSLPHRIGFSVCLGEPQSRRPLFGGHKH